MHIDETTLGERLDHLADLMAASERRVSPDPSSRRPRRSIVGRYWPHAAVAAAVLIVVVAAVASRDETVTTTERPTTSPSTTTTTEAPVITVPGEMIPGYEMVVDSEGRVRGYIKPGGVVLDGDGIDVGAVEVWTNPDTGHLNGYFIRQLGFVEIDLAENPDALRQALDERAQVEQELIEDLEERCGRTFDEIQRDPNFLSSDCN